MPKKEAPLGYLERFIPSGAVPLVLAYLHQYHIHLTITKDRKSVLGDYRNATRFKNHRISINGNLNAYSFLITLIHELAHLITYVQYSNGVLPHGREWKSLYRKMLEEFIRLEIFPDDILASFKRTLHDLPASSCSDEDLMRVLRKYDPDSNGLVLLEQLGEGNLFRLDDGKVFKKGRKMRKRFQCQELSTGQLYLFSPIYEVKAV